MRSSLDQFIWDIRAACDRGLPIQALDIVAGLERALHEKEHALQDSNKNRPVDFRVASDYAMTVARAAVTRIKAGTPR